MKLLPAVLLGIGLSSRANFVLILPLVFAALIQTTGWRSATKHIAVACAAFAAVTAPFYLYDPQGFSPLHTSNKLGQFESLIPSPDIFMLLATGVVALALALIPANRNLDVMLANCAVVLALPVIFGIILSSVGNGSLTFEFAYYGLPSLIFGAAGFWAMLWERGGPAKGHDPARQSAGLWYS